jgi:hemerythrin
MALMDWHESLSVGIPTIDTEHKKLVSLLNDLHTAMREGKSKQAMGDVLNGLITYTATHFGTEEKFMTRTGYPEYAEHKKKHDDLVKQALDVKAAFEAGKTGVNMELMSFLKDWIQTHIVGTDKKLGAFLATKGIQ